MYHSSHTLPLLSSQLTNKNQMLFQHNKRQILRIQIRQRQVDEIKKQLRKKLLQPKQPSDYELLKSINLTKILNQLKQIGINHEIIQGMFLYASSQHSDHMFQLFDQVIINVLINHLIQPSTNRNQDQLKWDRKIFWILTNYTEYSEIINELYLQKVLCIQNCIESFVQKKENIPFLEETEENIILSLSNWMMKQKNCRCILQNHSELFLKVLRRFSKRKPTIAERVAQNTIHFTKIAMYYCKFINNLYSCIQYTEIDEQFQQNTLKQMRKILSTFVDKRTMNQQDKKITILILDAITKLFGHTFDRNPEIMISYFKYFKKLSIWFETFMKTQKETPLSDQVIISYISLLHIIYGPNIPENLQDSIPNFYVNFFNEHVGKVCTSMFQNKNVLFHTYTLRMLQSILMEGYMVELIFHDYLPVLSHIFYCIQYSNYMLKKQALLCLINLIKSTIYEQSECQNQILELLIANKISDILAFSLWSFVDTQLNLQLVSGIQILINTQQNQYQDKLKFWQLFQEAGGAKKMQKILNESSDDVLKGQTCKILDIVKNQHLT